MRGGDIFNEDTVGFESTPPAPRWARWRGTTGSPRRSPFGPRRSSDIAERTRVFPTTAPCLPSLLRVSSFSPLCLGFCPRASSCPVAITLLFLCSLFVSVTKYNLFYPRALATWRLSLPRTAPRPFFRIPVRSLEGPRAVAPQSDLQVDCPDSSQEDGAAGAQAGPGRCSLLGGEMLTPTLFMGPEEPAHRTLPPHPCPRRVALVSLQVCFRFSKQPRLLSAFAFSSTMTLARVWPLAKPLHHSAVWSPGSFSPPSAAAARPSAW